MKILNLRADEMMQIVDAVETIEMEPAIVEPVGTQTTFADRLQSACCSQRKIARRAKLRRPVGGWRVDVGLVEDEVVV